ncbi:MAG: DUF4157 domain-containing protein [Acidobacteria bacterium]|nr:DUF4157 domain-containing protein [Acidobacteriota bacterium]
MSHYNAENLETRSEAPQSGLSQPPSPQQTPITQPRAEHAAMQAGVGNAALAAAAANDSPPNNGNHFSLQSGYGNAAVSRLLIQRKAEGETIPGIPATPTQEQPTPGVATLPTAGQSSAGAAAKPAKALIVEDTVEILDPGQMRKSDFLTQLRTAVCNTTAEALADTPWSEAGCPYIDRWFGYYSAQSSQYIERATRKYAPEAAEATAASGYIPPITARVRRSVTTWATTGEMTGVPEGVPMGLPGAGLTGVAGGAVSGMASAASSQAPGAVGAPSAGGRVFYKERDGGARVADDPQVIQSQLGAGQSLDSGVESRMESAFGESFSGVQVHADANATELSDNLNARAFTVGEHVAFGAGEYQPGTMIGDALIAHELAHVKQQRGGGASVESKQDGAAEYSALEDDADRAAVGAVVSTWGGARDGLDNIANRAMPSLRSGLRFQRCGPSVPDETINWEDVNRKEYEAAVRKIRDLHEQEKKLFSQPGWDDKRAAQISKIQSDIATEVQNLQKMGIRRDAPDILKQILQTVPEELRQVTGKLQGGETPIYWGEKRQFKLNLDYLPPPRDVDYYVVWWFNPGTQKQGIFGSRKFIKDLTVSLDEEFWAYWNEYGAYDNEKAGKANKPGFSIIADIFLGGGKAPDKSFATQWIDLIEDKVPTSISINAPRIISMADPGATVEPGKQPPTIDYVLQNADVEFNLSWNVPAPGARNPRYGIIWSITDPANITRYRGHSNVNEWKVTYDFPKIGKHTVGAEIYPLSKWTSDPNVKPVAKATRELQSLSHEALGGLALKQTKKDVPNIDYTDYLKELDKQIGDIEKMQQAGSVQGKELAQRLEDLKKQREKVLDQVGARGATLPFPEKEADFNDKTTYVSSMPAVLSTPEYGGAFPLTVFVTMKKSGNSWDARITDTTTQDVIGWPGSASTPLAALEKAISKWRGSNEYPEKGSLHYSFERCGWNLSGSFGLSTFKKSFWKWFDSILFVAQAIIALVLLLVPEPTGATKAAGIALLTIGILRSAYNIYTNRELGRPVLDERNVLEAISIVASVVGIKGGKMMGAAGKSVAAEEALAGKALTTFSVGKGLVVMSASADVGTFVYIANDAINQLQAADNDPTIPEAQRERRVMETYARLFSQGLLILGSNAHLFQGAKPKGTNLGMFLDKVAGADAKIELDPVVRTRLQSEFRKINPEVDVSKLSDRELVMGLEAVADPHAAEKKAAEKKSAAAPPETKPPETKPPAPEKTPQQIAAERLVALRAERVLKQAKLEELRNLEKEIQQAENDRLAASREYDKATTPDAKQQALAKMRAAKARRDTSQAALDKEPSGDSLEGEIKKLNSQIEAELPKPTRPMTPLLKRYLTESGGRWGSTEVRALNDKLATELENQDYKITGGAGRAPEEWIPGPGGGTEGGSFVDITAKKGQSTVRIQTVTTLADGVTPTPDEAAAAARIRAAFPNDKLTLIPKGAK